MSQPQAARLSVSGTMLYSEAVGEGSVCLSLHGGPGTNCAGDVQRCTALAAVIGARFVCYDHRGHGRSEWVPVEQCTHDQLVADVEGVRQVLGLGRIRLLGNSWGGYLALMFAARYPEQVAKLIVNGASASYDFMPLAEANARRLATPEQWAAYRALWDGSIRDDETFRRSFELIRPLYFSDRGAAAKFPPADPSVPYRVAVRNYILHHEFPTYDCRAELGRIRCPTLVLAGRQDWISPVELAEEIHRLIPGSELVIFERSGHMPQVEEPEAFVRVVREFLHRPGGTA